jgi:hypothetical protein
MRKLGIRGRDMWRRRATKGFLAILVALMIESINEIQPADLKAS